MLDGALVAFGGGNGEGSGKGGSGGGRFSRSEGLGPEGAAFARLRGRLRVFISKEVGNRKPATRIDLPWLVTIAETSSLETQHLRDVWA